MKFARGAAPLRFGTGELQARFLVLGQRGPGANPGSGCCTSLHYSLRHILPAHCHAHDPVRWEHTLALL